MSYCGIRGATKRSVDYSLAILFFHFINMIAASSTAAGVYAKYMFTGNVSRTLSGRTMVVLLRCWWLFDWGESGWMHSGVCV